MFSFSVAFANPKDFSAFRDVFGRCMYETQFKESFQKVKENDRDFLIDAYMEDVEMDDYFEEDEEEEQVDSEEELDDGRASSSRPNEGIARLLIEKTMLMGAVN